MMRVFAGFVSTLPGDSQNGRDTRFCVTGGGNFFHFMIPSECATIYKIGVLPCQTGYCGRPKYVEIEPSVLKSENFLLTVTRVCILPRGVFKA